MGAVVGCGAGRGEVVGLGWGLGRWFEGGAVGGRRLGGSLILAGLIEVAFDHSDGVGWVFAKESGGESGKVGDEAVVEGVLEGGKGRGEQCSVSEGDEFGGGGGANGGVGSVGGQGAWVWGWGWGWECEVPEAGGRRAVAGEDNGVVEGYGGGGGRECNGASSITELPHGDKRSGCEFGDNVNVAGGRREKWEVEVSLMGGSHETAVRVLYGDGVEGGSFVDDGGENGAEVGGAASIGNGEVSWCDEWGGRTYMSVWRFAFMWTS